MKISRKDGPAILKPITATPSATNNDSRQKAIAAFNSTPKASESAPVQQAASAQGLPVNNASQVTPEELGAIRQTANVAQSEGTASNIEASAQTATASPAATTESKVESPASEAANPQLSSQYAQLARKEKAIRAQVRAIEAEKARISTLEAEMKAKEQRYQEITLQERIRKNPIEVLNELGVTYDQLTEAAINAPKVEDPTIVSLKAEIKALRDAQEKTTKNFEDQQTQSYKQAVNQIRMETKQLVNADESFETIKATQSYNDVVDLIEQTYKQDGILLTVEEAAREVEDYLVEQAVKLARLKKIQGKLIPQQSAAQTANAAPVASGNNKQSQAKTLTNNIASTRQLTAKERAVLAFQGKLQK